MPQITVTDSKGEEHIVYYDQEDDAMIKAFHWTWKNGYAVTNRNKKVYQMHRMLMNVPLGHRDILVDHFDTDHHNNRKSNLRKCNRFQNQQNRSTNKGNTLPKGISLLPSGNYRVRVQSFNKRITVGTYETLEQAVEERNAFAKRQHKEFFNPSYILEANNETM